MSALRSAGFTARKTLSPSPSPDDIRGGVRLRPVARPMGRSELTTLVGGLAADRSAWAHLVRRPPDRRWWTRLVSNSRVDVWLLSWPGQGSVELHSHGKSAAALTVVEGTLEHVLASKSGELSTEMLSPGALLTVEPQAVHDVRNPGTLPALSIHGYAPPLEEMTFFRRGTRGLEPVRTTRGDGPGIEIPW